MRATVLIVLVTALGLPAVSHAGYRDPYRQNAQVKKRQDDLVKKRTASAALQNISRRNALRPLSGLAPTSAYGARVSTAALNRPARVGAFKRLGLYERIGAAPAAITSLIGESAGRARSTILANVRGSRRDTGASIFERLVPRSSPATDSVGEPAEQSHLFASLAL